MIPADKDRRCIDIKRDRLVGAEAEERFCEIMRANGYRAERLQPKAKKGAATKTVKGQRIVVGDVDVFPPKEGEFNAEVKSKYPNEHGAYGMEEYRVNHYVNYERLTGIPVVYVIEKTRDSKNSREIPVEERKWIWKSFRELLKHPYKTFPGLTWMDAPQTRTVPICYFNEEWFNDMETDWWE